MFTRVIEKNYYISELWDIFRKAASESLPKKMAMISFWIQNFGPIESTNIENT